MNEFSEVITPVTSSTDACGSSIAGTFWRATDPSVRSPGHLELAKQASPSLTVSPSLYGVPGIVTIQVAGDGSVAAKSESTDPGIVVIHGELEDDIPITLLEARSMKWAGGLTREKQKQRFEGIFAVVGAHLDNVNHHFEGLRVRLQTLTRAADTASAPVQLGNGGQLFWEDFSGEPQLVLTNLPPVGMHILERTYLQPLVTLLQLATARPVTVMEFAVQEHSQAPWWPVHSPSQHGDDLALPSQPLLPLTDLSPAVIGAWLDRVETLGPLPAGVASVLTASLPLETQVLILSTVSEGLHRRLFPDAQRFSPELAAQIREAAAEAVKKVDKSAAEAVKGFLGHMHEPGYGQRLNQLALDAEALVPGVTGRSNKWKTLVYGARNDFAHQINPGWLEDGDVDRYLTVALSLRWVLRALLLGQAGLHPDLLRRRFAESQEYGFFLRNVHEWRPDVYPDAHPSKLRESVT
ncbi:HEPN domain-containing protein [Nonomuraea angiospora]|uniref:Apea-like HEPN domain-containing protein n=1 Tax=Nonomuraea angiospora TaxID=46172 RepID=A0ABR9M4N8_9ACTN|nr:HEPN domain-containing protein [Nonomuraea angiospora]MBE1587858.1 hypothetical protein [Nonomuraea angiospora]